MPKPKNKKAAFKKHAVSFQLIHRSQHVSGRRLVRVAELTFNFHFSGPLAADADTNQTVIQPNMQKVKEEEREH